MINFDTISIACAAREMEQAVVGARVERVAQPSAHATQWTLYVRGIKQTVWIETDAVSSRLHLTRRGRQSPPNPPAFCMLLRKLIGGAWLEGIDRPQGMGERIVCLHFASPESGLRYRLMVELMGRHGNQILVGDATGTDPRFRSSGSRPQHEPRPRSARRHPVHSAPAPPARRASATLFSPVAGNDLPEQSVRHGSRSRKSGPLEAFAGVSPP